jgi:hypothetical protein
MKLLIESDLTPEVATEVQNDKAGRTYFIEGVFLQADTQNRNGRVYPQAVLDKEVERYINEVIDLNLVNSCGELCHPADSPEVTPDRISHRILSLTKEGKNYIGKAKILTDFPCGKLVKGLIDEGIKVGVSSRALGSLMEVNGAQEVQDDFRLSTVDIVSEPSVRDAIVEAIIESKEWDFVDGKIVEIVTEKIKSASRRNLEEAKLKALSIFFSSLKMCK